MPVRSSPRVCAPRFKYATRCAVQSSVTASAVATALGSAAGYLGDTARVDDRRRWLSEQLLPQRGSSGPQLVVGLVRDHEGEACEALAIQAVPPARARGVRAELA